jgi:hypothetical protein
MGYIIHDERTSEISRDYEESSFSNAKNSIIGGSLKNTQKLQKKTWDTLNEVQGRAKKS